MADERRLTTGEASLCGMIFRDSIPTPLVRIVRRKVGYGGFTPFEKVNVDEGHYKPDYVGSDLLRLTNVAVLRGSTAAQDAHWFVHELAHVWQYFVGMPKAPMFFKARREGRKLLRQRTGAIDLDTYDGDAAIYAYRIDRPGLDLLDFNLEQQCEIIADYFAWTLWNLKPDFKWNDWPMPTVEQLIAVLTRFNQDPAYPRREGRGNARRANWRS